MRWRPSTYAGPVSGKLSSEGEPPVDVSGPTGRVRRKADKLHRIRLATRALVSRQGFDATTIRQIAEEAGVGLATLFDHASDKRDLLFLACNDDLRALTVQAFDDAPPEAALAEQLTTVFRHFFIYYAQDRTLSRDLLRELTFFDTGRHSADFQAIRGETVGRIRGLIDAASARGDIRPSQSTETVADVIFFVFAAEVRRWLGSGREGPEQGVRHLARLLDVVISGLAPG